MKPKMFLIYASRSSRELWSKLYSESLHDKIQNEAIRSCTKMLRNDDGLDKVLEMITAEAEVFYSGELD